MNDVAAEISRLSGIPIEVKGVVGGESLARAHDAKQPDPPTHTPPRQNLEIWETYNNTLFQRFSPRDPAFKLVATDIIIASEVAPELPLRVFMGHREGPADPRPHAKQSDLFFGVPLLLSVDPHWTVFELKMHACIQMAAWFRITDAELERCAFQFKVGQLWLGQREHDFSAFDEDG